MKENNCIFEKNNEINDYLKETGIINENIENKQKKIYGKHFLQMKKTEISYLLNYKDKILKEGLYFAKHSILRMNERHIRKYDVIEAIRNGQLIDYRLINNNEIITLRGCHIKRQKQVYVILCLTTKTIITTYSNKFWERYKKIKCEKYEDIKISIPKNFSNKNILYS